jgi:hypothetical protein
MTTQEKINDLVKKLDNARTSEQKRNLQILIDNQKAFLKNNNQGLKKPQTMKNVTKKEGLKKDGTLKKGYKYIDGGKIVKTSGLNAPATKGLRTLCAKAYSITGLRKKDGTQKKGYVAKKGGKIVKTNKKPVAKKATNK